MVRILSVTFFFSVSSGAVEPCAVTAERWRNKEQQTAAANRKTGRADGCDVTGVRAEGWGDSCSSNSYFKVRGCRKLPFNSQHFLMKYLFAATFYWENKQKQRSTQTPANYWRAAAESWVWEAELWWYVPEPLFFLLSVEIKATVMTSSSLSGSSEKRDPWSPSGAAVLRQRVGGSEEQDERGWGQTGGDEPAVQQSECPTRQRPVSRGSKPLSRILFIYDSISNQNLNKHC